MSLLPIIYTSLFIFASLMAVVVIVSYILYKVKQKDAEPENSAYYDNAYVPAPVTAGHTQYTAAVTQAPVQSFTNSGYQEQKRTTATVTSNYSERYEQKSPTRDFSTRKRFQVMNNNNSGKSYLSNLQPITITDSKFDRNAFSEYNLLNYYSDKKEDNFSNIPIDRYRKTR